MDKYIDRQTAIAKLTALEVSDSLATIADAKRVIADMAAVDVVPVVRCGKCKYLRPRVNIRTGETISYWCYLGIHDIDANGFCSFGVLADRG